TYHYDPVVWGKNWDASAPGLTWARDTRASSPMQNIYYEYPTRSSPTHQLSRFQGQILAEHYLNSDNSMGVAVSTLASNSDATTSSAVQTETRSDGPTCQIRMDKLNQGSGPPFTTWKSDYKGVQEKFAY